MKLGMISTCGNLVLGESTSGPERATALPDIATDSFGCQLLTMPEKVSMTVALSSFW